MTTLWIRTVGFCVVTVAASDATYSAASRCGSYSNCSQPVHIKRTSSRLPATTAASVEPRARHDSRGPGILYFRYVSMVSCTGALCTPKHSCTFAKRTVKVRPLPMLWKEEPG